MMNDVASALMLVGTAFMLLAAVGILRMPDLFMRISVTSKAVTLGIGLILLGTVVHFADPGVAIRALAVVFFSLLTAPVAAHMIARAAYITGVPLWEHTIVDELRGRYDLGTHALSSVPGQDAREAEGEPL